MYGSYISKESGGSKMRGMDVEKAVGRVDEDLGRWRGKRACKVGQRLRDRASFKVPRVPCFWLHWLEVGLGVCVGIVDSAGSVVWGGSGRGGRLHGGEDVCDLRSLRRSDVLRHVHN